MSDKIYNQTSPKRSTAYLTLIALLVLAVVAMGYSFYKFQHRSVDNFQLNLPVKSVAPVQTLSDPANK
jgi:hypothetical protein